MPEAKISTVFNSAVSALRQGDTDALNATNGAGQRSWMMGPTLLWSGDILSPADIKSAFSRSSLATDYNNALEKTTGSAGDAASIKLQADHLGEQERSFRLRHLTPVRARVHVSGRQKGRSQTSAGAFGRVLTQAQDLIVSGSAGFKPRKDT